MYSNFFLSYEAPFVKVRIPFYETDLNIAPKDYYSICKGFEWYLFNRGFFPASYGNKILFMGTGTVESTINYQGYDFILSSEPIELNAQTHHGILTHILNSALRRIAFKNGFKGPESQKYFKRDPYKEEGMIVSSIQFSTKGEIDTRGKPLSLIKQALKENPDFILLQELFNTVYFHQYEDKLYFELAEDHLLPYNQGDSEADRGDRCHRCGTYIFY